MTPSSRGWGCFIRLLRLRLSHELAHGVTVVARTDVEFEELRGWWDHHIESDKSTDPLARQLRTKLSRASHHTAGARCCASRALRERGAAGGKAGDSEALPTRSCHDATTEK